MHISLVAGRKTRGYTRYSPAFISFTVLPDRPLQSTLESRSRRSPVPSTTSSFPMTRSNLVVPRQEASPFRSVSLMLFVLAFLRHNLTNYVCTQISYLINSCIRILGSLVCNIVTFILFE